MKRKPVSNKTSKRVFAKSAARPHPKNTRPAPSRGGIRL